MFKRILIANRGEIACRIARTCRQMGIEYVSVYSQVDANAPHLDGAAVSVSIGSSKPSQSYLDGAKLIRAAVETGCDAIHPGYGFLSENADFARDVTASGLVFIGPKPNTIADMGDKATAKKIMAAAGVPTVPGSTEASDVPETIERHLSEIGYPALLKPAAGGGGKGMSVIRSGNGRQEIESAIRTALANFGDGRLLVERYVEEPRHVEVQVFGDGNGGFVHLFERECSLQRRHQKIIEEAPAVFLPQDIRTALHDAAMQGARAINYLNAGTFEFIVGKDGRFYFLEVNTRLQVEHPVTEEITGIDLVEWQIRIACGFALPLSQSEIRVAGHAIECRIYAEDPGNDFRPSPGRIDAIHWPKEARIETGVTDGTVVPPDYDPMIAKLIVKGSNREAALKTMTEALENTAILGLSSNIGFLNALLATETVKEDVSHTGFVDHALAQLLPKFDAANAQAAASAAILCAYRTETAPDSPWANPLKSDRDVLDPRAPLGRIAFHANGGWRSTQIKGMRGTLFVIELNHEMEGPQTRTVEARRSGKLVTGTVGGTNWFSQVTPEAVELFMYGNRFRFDRSLNHVNDCDGDPDIVTSVMPGAVVAIQVKAGALVKKGETLVVVEAMKFETPFSAPRDGVVSEICCKIGDQVRTGQTLVRIGDAAPDAAG